MLVLAALLALGSQHFVDIRRELLGNPDGGQPRLMVIEPEDRLKTPKLSPKKFGESKISFEFDYVTSGYSQLDPKHNFLLRFRVFQQEQNSKNDLAPQVARMLLRLWEYNYWHLKLDHLSQLNLGIVDCYLCWGGTPGGEQLVDVDQEAGIRRKVDTIYIYDLNSFTDPIEMAREVAHEYGHASMPPIGGFVSPEDWGNGFMGEKLFLTYLRNRMRKGELVPDDAMGASLVQLDKWVTTNVDPLVLDAAKAGPNNPLLGGTGQAAMNAYIGLNLYASEVLPEPVFAQSLRMIGSTSAKDIPQAISDAVEMPQTVQLTIPNELVGKDIWIPTASAGVSGATVLKKVKGWALVRATKTVVLKNHDLPPPN